MKHLITIVGFAIGLALAGVVNVCAAFIVYFMLKGVTDYFQLPEISIFAIAGNVGCFTLGHLLGYHHALKHHALKPPHE